MTVPLYQPESPVYLIEIRRRSPCAVLLVWPDEPPGFESIPPPPRGRTPCPPAAERWGAGFRQIERWLQTSRWPWLDVSKLAIAVPFASGYSPSQAEAFSCQRSPVRM